MSAEKVRPESYKRNRKRVFQIYGIDPKNREYNCHHIVTKEDVRKGLMPSEFKLNAMSNLYPLKIADHTDLHKRIKLMEKENISQEMVEDNTTPTQEPIGVVLVINKEERVWSLLKYKNRDNIITRKEIQEYKNREVS